jgi:NitT/TauT family transport system ATP-binding protein
MARAFSYNSDLLLMDEPFSNLDLGLKLRLINIFKTLWKNNKKTTVFVTHDLDEAIMLSDRIILIDNGKIIFDLNLPHGKKEYNSYPEIKKQLLNKIIK